MDLSAFRLSPKAGCEHGALLDQSPPDKRRQAQVRERGGDVYRLKIMPAVIWASIMCHVSCVKFDV